MFDFSKKTIAGQALSLLAMTRGKIKKLTVGEGLILLKDNNRECS